MKKIALMLVAATMVLAACNRNKKTTEEQEVKDSIAVAVDTLFHHEQLPEVEALVDDVETAAPVEVPQADLKALPSDAKTRRANRNKERAESERDRMDSDLAEEARELQENDQDQRSEYQRY